MVNAAGKLAGLREGERGEVRASFPVVLRFTALSVLFFFLPSLCLVTSRIIESLFFLLIKKKGLVIDLILFSFSCAPLISTTLICNPDDEFFKFNIADVTVGRKKGYVKTLSSSLLCHTKLVN
ncbi:hypothetical protein Droror1_Dr00022557 [Drosera rotundifolia]